MKLKKYISGIMLAGSAFAYFFFSQGYHIRVAEYFEKKTPAVQLSEKEEMQDSHETIDEKIKIASFNIQVFGKSKRGKDEVMDSLSEIAREFDIIAVQEVRDKTKTTVSYFVSRINESEGPDYSSIESERLGRTNSKEQYAFVYNSSKVEFSGISYVYDDKRDVFEREPFVAGFRSGNFDYILVNVHIKPDDAEEEIAELEKVVADADSMFENDSDVIVLGDFNADGSYFSESCIKGIRNPAVYVWAISDEMDTTVSSNNYTYDRIVFMRNFTSEDYTGSSGVFDFEQKLNLNHSFAKTVSDHYPVWAEFRTGNDTD